VYPSGGVSDADRLNAVAQGTQLAEKNIKAGAIFMAENAAAEGIGQLIGLGFEAVQAARAARAASESVDLVNISNKIERQMVQGGWTKQEILDTIENGEAHGYINKKTGGATIEYVSRSTGKFVVVESTSREILQVSRSGMKPNYLVPPFKP
jgi:hypothetical protein